MFLVLLQDASHSLATLGTCYISLYYIFSNLDGVLFHFVSFFSSEFQTVYLLLELENIKTLIIICIQVGVTNSSRVIREYSVLQLCVSCCPYDESCTLWTELILSRLFKCGPYQSRFFHTFRRLLVRLNIVHRNPCSKMFWLLQCWPYFSGSSYYYKTVFVYKYFILFFFFYYLYFYFALWR